MLLQVQANQAISAMLMVDTVIKMYIGYVL